MSKPMRRAAAIVATAALAVSLSACTGGRWEPEAPPAAGTQTDAADGAIKLRNFVVISDMGGEAILVGGITSRDAANEVTAIGITAQAADGSFGAEQVVDFSEQIPRGQTITLDGSRTKFTDPDLILGRLAGVTVGFADGQTASLQVPVYASDHPDFAEAWNSVWA
ncbi:MAG: hypothetical protein IPJ61_02340 [Tessaracoccus sp.]|uniref:hypothetical protein n=1 Tax=Tessaracoccus sp. TaxID=1971211 RepID=UPI001EC9874B|nr:hypothetical protein [Tessaracoccus sp.]MBK7819929.1 hypothetical protein [Tessaracoccus sp.]